jgi:hypothetical protein
VSCLDPCAQCLQRRRRGSPTAIGDHGDASHRLQGDTSPPSRDTLTGSHGCRRQPSTNQEVSARSVRRGIQADTPGIQADTSGCPASQRVHVVRVSAPPEVTEDEYAMFELGGQRRATERSSGRVENHSPMPLAPVAVSQCTPYLRGTFRSSVRSISGSIPSALIL